MIGNKFAHIPNDFYGIEKDRILRRVQAVVLENKDYPFVYSNFGISVVGLVLESVYSDSFTNIMNDFIRDDLHLQNTEAAKGNGNLDKYWKWKRNDGYIPAGSIISNIESMAIYLQLHMNNTISYLPMTYSKIKDINANQAIYEAMNIRMGGVGMTWMLDDKNDIVWRISAMINGNLSQFLDTGWWNADATIYYKDHIYFLEGFFDKQDNMRLRIMKWKAKNLDDKTYEDIYDENGKWIDFNQMEMEAPNEEALREKFLKAKIWDGKSFWEVEKELAWLD